MRARFRKRARRRGPLRAWTSPRRYGSLLISLNAERFATCLAVALVLANILWQFPLGEYRLWAGTIPGEPLRASDAAESHIVPLRSNPSMLTGEPAKDRGVLLGCSETASREACSASHSLPRVWSGGNASKGNWTLQPTSSSPGAVSEQGMAYDPSLRGVLSFGGLGTGPGCTSQGCNATWLYANSTWTLLTPGISPSPRYSIAIAFDDSDSYLLLFGGEAPGTGTGCPNDTWKFANGTWADLNLSGGPTPRSAAAITYDSALGGVLLFGGLSGCGAIPLNDTWLFKAGGWSKLSNGSGPPGGSGTLLSDDPPAGGAILYGAAGNQTWLFAAGSWHQIPPSGPTPDSNGTAFAYDGFYRTPVLFDEPHFPGEDATWSLETTGWVELHPKSEPFGYFDSMAFDPAASELVLFGASNLTASLNETWLFGSGLVTLDAAPASYGGITVEWPNGTLIAPGGDLVELGFGSYRALPRPNAWATFNSWDTAGALTLSGTAGPVEEVTVFGNGTLEANYLFFPSVLFRVEPAGCGSLAFNGTLYADNASARVLSSSYAIYAGPCSTGLLFGSWNVSGNVSVKNSTSPSATALVLGNGTLSAVYVAPVTVAVRPFGLGSVLVGSQTVSRVSNLTLRTGLTSASVLPDAWARFVGWTATGGVSVRGTQLSIFSGGSATANFALFPSIEIAVSPSECGPLTINGSSEPSGHLLRLDLGTYSLAASACAGGVDLFERWQSTTNLTLGQRGTALTTLSVDGNGSLTAVYVEGDAVSVSLLPAEGGSVTIAGSTVGNGTSLRLLAGNYSILVRPNPGWRFFRWSTSGQLEVSASSLAVLGNGSLIVEFERNSTTNSFVWTPALLLGTIALGVGLVLAATVVLVILRRRRTSTTGRVHSGGPHEN
jgi:List-Bact-rpt repeat protein